MQFATLRKLILLTVTLTSLSAYASTQHLQETDALDINTINDYQLATFDIRYPASDNWVENGKVNISRAMPACIFALGQALDDQQVELVLKQLRITNLNSQVRELTLDKYKGTYTYFDDDPGYNTLVQFFIQPKNNLTFGQVLQAAGGTNDSHVWVYFDRGCKSLATRPHYPKNLK
jgi:hypothetical protein